MALGFVFCLWRYRQTLFFSTVSNINSHCSFSRSSFSTSLWPNFQAEGALLAVSVLIQIFISLPSIALSDQENVTGHTVALSQFSHRGRRKVLPDAWVFPQF